MQNANEKLLSQERYRVPSASNHEEQDTVPPLSLFNNESNQCVDNSALNRQCPLHCANCHQQFYKTLNECIVSVPESRKKIEFLDEILNNEIDDNYTCSTCKLRHDECKKFVESIRNRLASSVTTALAAYDAVEHLNRFYLLWHQYKSDNEPHCQHTNNESGNNGNNNNNNNNNSNSNNKNKEENVCTSSAKLENKDTIQNNESLPTQRSLYRDCNSKVSKWTKVKAAFKWERADIGALQEPPRNVNSHNIYNNNAGLIPNNHEVARYLQVPVMSCGGSSPDSFLSSSSGQLLSETTGGTPGTISSASSIDDIFGHSTISNRRDSSKSDHHCDYNALIVKSSNCQEAEIKCKENDITTKVRRKSYANSDVEAMRDDPKICITKPIELAKIKKPPRPLNLELKTVFTDSDGSSLLKSPKLYNQTSNLNRVRKISSPGNSSVPSSPSRNSDFYAEFESEDLSSGEFSEPTSPNGLNNQQTQDEIQRRYNLLRSKLDKEFLTKQKEWNKQKTNANKCRAIALKTSPMSDEYSPIPLLNTNISTELLEENLTPEFKKKLRKWCAKKQLPTAQIPPVSPVKDTKIDWNLWKLYGHQQTIEGCHMHLPEDFQKKLEQWDKMKRNGSLNNSSSKLMNKSTDSTTKKSASEGDRLSRHSVKEKRKTEKDKPERLSKLKSIVNDHPVKEIKVKTSVGVMKFEGISRKFTRKLYEWEKARGIGPESSTFALLHPGYCPIDVDHIPKDYIKNVENSPTISHSLSLDSIAPNIAFLTSSQRASSLSLNNINDLNDIDDLTQSCNKYKSFIDTVGADDVEPDGEPEAVMVEVEDHIVETARQLITQDALVEQKIPVYKYEEIVCNDFCNSKRIQSYESHTNLAPLLSALNHTDEVIMKLKKSYPDIGDNTEIHYCIETLSHIRSIYPRHVGNLMKSNVINAILDVQSELDRIIELSKKSPLDEACCQEIMEERNAQYNEEFMGLRESLELLKSKISDGSNAYTPHILPDINIISEDALDSSICEQTTTIDSNKDASKCCSHNNNRNTNIVSCNKADTKQVLNGNILEHMPIISSSATTVSNNKKKLRVRKVGSRQNSKTESSDSSDDGQYNAIVETPRRVKRKNFRLKQRSLDEDVKKFNDSSSNSIFKLKMKSEPQIEVCNELNLRCVNDTKLEFITKQSSHEILDQRNCNEESSNELLTNANIFVKTKRKLFTTIEVPCTLDGIAVIEYDVDSSEPSDNDKAVQDTIGSNENTVTVEMPNIKQWRRKCLSLTNLGNRSHVDDERLYQSLGNLSKSKICSFTEKPSLASDSLRLLRQNIKEKTMHMDNMMKHTEKLHLFKKNTDKLSMFHTKTTTASALKRIGSKLSKTLHSTWAQENISALVANQIGAEATATDCVTSQKSTDCSTINTAVPLNVTIEDNFVECVPPTVTRSGKISSKLGFATLASKFRRVKGKRDKHKYHVHSNTMHNHDVAINEGLEPIKCENVLKSQSLPQHCGINRNTAVSEEIELIDNDFILEARTKRIDTNLNKSQSENIVIKYPKESYV